MSDLFSNFKRVVLNEVKENDNYESYKGIVYDPENNEFKVIEGKFRDKKDFYEKMVKRNLVLRKCFEKRIFDWIEEHSPNNLIAYLMFSTAFSKWKNNNLLSEYYVQLLNDIPYINREGRKGDPQSRGKDIDSGIGEAVEEQDHYTDDANFVVTVYEKDNSKLSGNDSKESLSFKAKTFLNAQKDMDRLTPDLVNKLKDMILNKYTDQLTLFYTNGETENLSKKVKDLNKEVNDSKLLEKQSKLSPLFQPVKTFIFDNLTEKQAPEVKKIKEYLDEIDNFGNLFKNTFDSLVKELNVIKQHDANDESKHYLLNSLLTDNSIDLEDKESFDKKIKDFFETRKEFFTNDISNKEAEINEISTKIAKIEDEFKNELSKYNDTEDTEENELKIKDIRRRFSTVITNLNSKLSDVKNLLTIDNKVLNFIETEEYDKFVKSILNENTLNTLFNGVQELYKVFEKTKDFTEIRDKLKKSSEETTSEEFKDIANELFTAITADVNKDKRAKEIKDSLIADFNKLKTNSETQKQTLKIKDVLKELPEKEQELAFLKDILDTSLEKIEAGKETENKNISKKQKIRNALEQYVHTLQKNKQILENRYEELKELNQNEALDPKDKEKNLIEQDKIQTQLDQYKVLKLDDLKRIGFSSPYIHVEMYDRNGSKITDLFKKEESGRHRDPTIRELVSDINNFEKIRNGQYGPNKNNIITDRAFSIFNKKDVVYSDYPSRKVLDDKGNDIGTVSKKRAIVDNSNKEIIGYTDKTKQNNVLHLNDMTYVSNNNAVVVDKDNKNIGKISTKNRIIADNKNKVIGYISNDNVIRSIKDKEKIGEIVSEIVCINDKGNDIGKAISNSRFIFNNRGEKIGEIITDTGEVVNIDNKTEVIGKIKEIEQAYSFEDKKLGKISKIAYPLIYTIDEPKKTKIIGIVKDNKALNLDDEVLGDIVLVYTNPTNPNNKLAIINNELIKSYDGDKVGNTEAVLTDKYLVNENKQSNKSKEIPLTYDPKKETIERGNSILSTYSIANKILSFKNKEQQEEFEKTIQNINSLTPADKEKAKEQLEYYSKEGDKALQAINAYLGDKYKMAISNAEQLNKLKTASGNKEEFNKTITELGEQTLKDNYKKEIEDLKKELQYLQATLPNPIHNGTDEKFYNILDDHLQDQIISRTDFQKKKGLDKDERDYINNDIVKQKRKNNESIKELNKVYNLFKLINSHKDYLEIENDIAEGMFIEEKYRLYKALQEHFELFKKKFDITTLDVDEALKAINNGFGKIYNKLNEKSNDLDKQLNDIHNKPIYKNDFTINKKTLSTDGQRMINNIINNATVTPYIMDPVYKRIEEIDQFENQEDKDTANKLYNDIKKADHNIDAVKKEISDIEAVVSKIRNDNDEIEKEKQLIDKQSKEILNEIRVNLMNRNSLRKSKSYDNDVENKIKVIDDENKKLKEQLDSLSVENKKLTYHEIPDYIDAGQYEKELKDASEFKKTLLAKLEQLLNTAPRISKTNDEKKESLHVNYGVNALNNDEIYGNNMFFESNDDLNTALFENGVLNEKVRLAMIKVADLFKDKLDLTLEPIDVYFTGSNASYNYNDKSDIDLHLIYDFEEAGMNAELLKKYLQEAKQNFNNRYDIKLKGYKVEVGYENNKEPLVASGIYSVIGNCWIKYPNKVNHNEEINIDREYSELVLLIDKVISTKNSNEIVRLWKKLGALRRKSLNVYGEYGKGNLVFKKLRNEGYLDKLKNVYYKTASNELSLESWDMDLCNEFIKTEDKDGYNKTKNNNESKIKAVFNDVFKKYILEEDDNSKNGFSFDYIKRIYIYPERMAMLDEKGIPYNINKVYFPLELKNELKGKCSVKDILEDGTLICEIEDFDTKEKELVKFTLDRFKQIFGKTEAFKSLKKQQDKKISGDYIKYDQEQRDLIKYIREKLGKDLANMQVTIKSDSNKSKKVFIVDEIINLNRTYNLPIDTLIDACIYFNRGAQDPISNEEDNIQDTKTKDIKAKTLSKEDIHTSDEIFAYDKEGNIIGMINNNGEYETYEESHSLVEAASEKVLTKVKDVVNFLTRDDIKGISDRNKSELLNIFRNENHFNVFNGTLNYSNKITPFTLSGIVIDPENDKFLGVRVKEVSERDKSYRQSYTISLTKFHDWLNNPELNNTESLKDVLQTARNVDLQKGGNRTSAIVGARDQYKQVLGDALTQKEIILMINHFEANAERYIGYLWSPVLQWYFRYLLKDNKPHILANMYIDNGRPIGFARLIGKSIGDGRSRLCRIIGQQRNLYLYDLSDTRKVSRSGSSNTVNYMATRR